MKCKYCHAEVENDAVFCPNCGKELPKRKRCIKCGETLDEDSEFCPKCGTQQTVKTPESPQQRSTKAPLKKNNNSFLSKPWVIILMILLLGILLYFLFFSDGGKRKNNDSAQEEQVAAERLTAVDSDYVYQEKAAIEQQQKEDSLMKVAKMKSDSLASIKDSLNSLKSKEKSSKAQPSQSTSSSPRANVARQNSTQTGTKNLGYGSYKGSLVGGKPHGVNGRLVFKTVHQIDSRDPKGRVAEPGDYVIGEFYEGHLVQGIWYDANNQVKGSIIIGR